ncbi:hypothetical protein L210DRAFT_932927 [Boletus edulis BED1]|uniref:Uncharacterized protein n=1 Tax=Boletus edulis BED1 TaxID=1328754 RepID=A0AAD4BL16_BOLED|nr:hypothetical protein L210DRAFT_932927 [Boletus edulis BED1]
MTASNSPAPPVNHLAQMIADASEDEEDEETQVTKHGSFYLMQALVTHEAVPGKSRVTMVKAALKRASESITGHWAPVSAKVQNVTTTNHYTIDALYFRISAGCLTVASNVIKSLAASNVKMNIEEEIKDDNIRYTKRFQKNTHVSLQGH